MVSQRRKTWIRLLPVDSRQMSQPTVLRAGQTQPESLISVNESCIHPSQHNDARLHQKTLSQYEKKVQEGCLHWDCIILHCIKAGLWQVWKQLPGKSWSSFREDPGV